MKASQLYQGWQISYNKLQHKQVIKSKINKDQDLLLTMND